MRIRLTALTQRFLRSQRGSVAIQIGLMATALIGMAALGVEITMALYKQRQFQMFADTAAYSGAVALKSGQNHVLQANAVVATLVALNNAGVGVTTTVESPIPSGPYAEQEGVRVTVSQPQSLQMVSVVCGWFGCNFDPTLVNVRARAVAIINAAGTYCVLALSKTASPAIKVSGGGNVTLKGCSMRGSSGGDPSIWVTGGGRITATIDQTTKSGGTVTAAGTVTNTGGGTINADGGVKENYQQTISDPFSGVTPPTITNPCAPIQNKGETEIEHSCTFASAGKITLNSDQTLKLGSSEGASTTYVFTKDLSITGGKLEVENATIVLTGSAQFSFTGIGSVQITASQSGTLKDIAVIGYGQSSNLTSKFAGGSNQSITGSIYLPTQNLTYAGGSASGSTRCLELVANTVEYTGAAQFSVNCVGHALPTIGGEQVNLVE